MRCLGRTETDRKITNEPWSSKQNLAEQRRPLFGVNGVVRPKNKRKMQKGLDRAGTVRDAWLTVPAQPVDATLSDLEIPYKQVVLSLRTNLASPPQRKRLIFGPFKGPGCQFNTLEKCSVMKFLQAGLARVLRRPIETARQIGNLAHSTQPYRSSR